MDDFSREAEGQPEGILVDSELLTCLGSSLRAAPGAAPSAAGQVQPASVDLRLGPRAWRIRAGFLPSTVPVEERLDELSLSHLDLEGDGAVLERGLVYLIRLDEDLELPPGVRARFNPRSSSGRCDLFTRVLIPGHARFDEAPEGYAGPLWLEVAPLSFPVRLRRGDRLCQVRLARGRAHLEKAELEELYAATPLCFDGERALAADEVRFDERGGLELRLGLADREPAGWRAATQTELVEFALEGAHDPHDFFEPVRAANGHCVLAPGAFYIFASRERLRIPPWLAAEMQPVDVGMGELRNNYAGFFDPGFGWHVGPAGEPLPEGTPAVLEVRAHDVPFLVEEGQVFFRLRFLRTAGKPQRLYGAGRSGGSYQAQDLTLARAFRRPAESPRERGSD